MTSMKVTKENMEFTFTPVRTGNDRIEVELYNTVYVLTKDKHGVWSNAEGNKFTMSDALINAIVHTLVKT